MLTRTVKLDRILRHKVVQRWSVRIGGISLLQEIVVVGDVGLLKDFPLIESQLKPAIDLGEDAGKVPSGDVVVDRGVKIPPGLIVGEDPELDAKRFRRTEGGVCLITQAMIDKLDL